MICNCPWVIRSRRNHKWVSENVIQAYIGKELFPLNADRFLSQMPSKMCRQIMSCSTIQHVASTSVFHTRYISEELLMEGDPVKFKCTSLRASLCNSIFSNFGQYLHKVYLLYQNYDNNCDNIAKCCYISTVCLQWFCSYWPRQFCIFFPWFQLYTKSVIKALRCKLIVSLEKTKLLLQIIPTPILFKTIRLRSMMLPGKPRQWLQHQT